jgi:hypothetical protein
LQVRALVSLQREDREALPGLALVAEKDAFGICSYRVPRMAWYSSADAATSCGMIRYSTP